jgi:hypothetical protein
MSSKGTLLTPRYHELGFDTEQMAAVGAGQIPGLAAVRLNGVNPAVAINTLEDVWQVGGLYTWLSAAVALEAISSDANDTVAGSGARKVIVEGLDASFLEVSEEIDMNGASASTATTQTFLRINRVYVSEHGTYGATTAGGNTGTITIRTESAGATHASIGLSTQGSAGFGVSRLGRYTVPAAKSALLVAHEQSVATGSTAEFHCWTRENADDVTVPVSSQQQLFSYGSFLGTQQVKHTIPHVLPAKTDLWFSAIGGAAEVLVTLAADLVLITNP